MRSCCLVIYLITLCESFFCPCNITSHLYLHIPWNVTKSSGGKLEVQIFPEQWSLLTFRDDRCRKCSWKFRGDQLNVWKGLLTAAVYCRYISRSFLYHNDPVWSRSYHKAAGTAIAFTFLTVELCAFSSSHDQSQAVSTAASMKCTQQTCGRCRNDVFLLFLVLFINPPLSLLFYSLLFVSLSFF